MMTAIFQIDNQTLPTIEFANSFKTPAIVCEGKPHSSYRVSAIDKYDYFHFDMTMMQQNMQGETILPENIETAEDVHSWIMSLSEHG